ncbi:MAG: WYL domain-containing protein [Muribaculaceae bacterium]|nr:WYL domain-containing protein [Muribaculaceae bacterium]
MAQTKNALLRQRVIDRCLASHKHYSVKAIMEKCNAALLEAGYGPVTSKTTIINDIDDIELNFPDAVIVREKHGRTVYYHYETRPFSIYHIPLSDNQMAQLTQTIAILSKFEGMPHFDWIDEFIDHFKTSLNIPTTRDTIVMFDDNIDYAGCGWFAELFGAIASQQALEIKYRPFGKKVITYLFHPYLLKQYNNRWFLFGYSEGYRALTCLALDRIKEISPADIAYRPNSEIDFQEYFDAMVGVWRCEADIPQKVQLRVSKTQYPYIATKPLHGTQRVLRREADSVVLQIEVIINPELVNLLQSFGPHITVLSPQALREELQAEAEKTLANYQSVHLN